MNRLLQRFTLHKRGSKGQHPPFSDILSGGQLRFLADQSRFQKGGEKLAAFRAEVRFQPGEGAFIPGGDKGVEKACLAVQPAQLFCRILFGIDTVIFRHAADGSRGNYGPHSVADGAEGAFLQKTAQPQLFVAENHVGADDGEHRLELVRRGFLTGKTYHQSGELPVGRSVGNVHQHSGPDLSPQLRGNIVAVFPICVERGLQYMHMSDALFHFAPSFRDLR